MKNAPRVEAVNRDRVIARDNSTCYLCHRLLAPHEIHLDHVVALHNGGDHTEDNLAVTCQPCNSSKGTKVLPRGKLPKHLLT